ncbi:hypothetical protein E1N52_27180 [Paraburkholderia guartelaensis]|uniref:Uncharacterized protein n=1 Tax=Paraburkholderia guartelaensis TaxID=2546446 RepID=A0A4V2ZVG9_9BURK|nr:hypothetical protein [Paraburkholderia guartelaensis]TDG05119.1 hypothetical protein E1N52_27180 [Paraburkholderia guartelaensis]
MYFKGLIAHSDIESEAIYLAAADFHLARQGAQLAYPNSRLVWLFPIDENDVPGHLRGAREEPAGRELLDISRAQEP